MWGIARARVVSAVCLSLWAAAGCESQTTTPPLETEVEEVLFTSDGTALAGTLVRPTIDGPSPAIVLIHGSQPGTRGAYLSLAEWFAERGVAALAFDRRGEGGSAGSGQNRLFATLAADVVAAIEHLAARPDVDGERVGVWGISQGGWLGPLAATMSDDVAFIVAVSGPLVGPGEQMLHYYGNVLEDAGVPGRTVEAVIDARRALWEYLRTGEGHEAVVAAVDAARQSPGYPGDEAPGGLPPGPVPDPTWVRDPANESELFWVRHEAVYDPVPVVEQVRVPMLAFFGTEDRLIPVTESVRRLEAIRAAAGVDVEIHVLEGANHGLRRVDAAGRPIDPSYRPAMESWLESVTSVRPTARR